MKKSYHIIDSDGRKIGILFIDVSPATDTPISSIFQSTQANPFEPTTHVEIEKTVKSFWASDGATYAITGAFVGAVLLSYAWVYSLDAGAWVVGGTLLTAVGLHLAKIWFHRPPRLEQDTPETKHTIAIETVENNGNSRHVMLDEIQDTSISLDELRRVAKAYADGTNFSRASMMLNARVSDGKYRKIKSEFERLNLLFTDKGSRNHLSIRGKAVLRRLAAD